MANHKSAKKRARQNVKRRARNRHVISGLRTAVKGVDAALAGDDAEARTAALRNAESTIRRAATKGALSKKQASRTVARLSRAVQRSSAG